MWRFLFPVVGPLVCLAIPMIGSPDNEGIATLEGVRIDQIPQLPSVEERIAAAIPRTGWTVTCDSQQTGFECTKAIDGNASTFWSSANGSTPAPLPHWILVDMKASYLVGNISISPRADGSKNGNIGQHTITLSPDGKTFSSPIAIGTYMDDTNLKTTVFTPATARYVKVTALTEAGGRGPWVKLPLQLPFPFSLYPGHDIVQVPCTPLGQPHGSDFITIE